MLDSNNYSTYYFSTKPLLPATKKEALPAHHHNNVIYQFMCNCAGQYVGHTSQRLQECIKQHISRSIRNYHSSQDCSNLSHACKTNSTSQVIAHYSAIGQHLLKKPFCASQYTDTKFSIFVEDVLLSTSLLLKLLLSNFFNLIYVDTRNFYMV